MLSLPKWHVRVECVSDTVKVFVEEVNAIY